MVHFVDEPKDYNFTESEQSQILSSFFYGYTVSVGSAGYVTDMYGGRYIVAVGIGLSGFIGLFQPLFVKWGVNWFITIRFLQGLAQGLTFTSQFWILKFENSYFLSVREMPWYPI